MQQCVTEHKLSTTIHSNEDSCLFEKLPIAHVNSNNAHLNTILSQLQREEDQFRKAMEEAKVELQLLRQHRAMLQEQLQQLESTKLQLLYVV